MTLLQFFKGACNQEHGKTLVLLLNIMTIHGKQSWKKLDSQARKDKKHDVFPSGELVMRVCRAIKSQTGHNLYIHNFCKLEGLAGNINPLSKVPWLKVPWNESWLGSRDEHSMTRHCCKIKGQNLS